MELVSELPGILQDPSFEIGRLLDCPSAINSLIRDENAVAEVRSLLAPGSPHRACLLGRLLSGSPIRIKSSIAALARIAPDLGLQVWDELSKPEVQWAVADRAKELPVHELSALLRWAYRREPDLGGRIERRIDGAVRRRLLGELIVNPSSVSAAMRGGEVAPVLHDVMREVVQFYDEHGSELPLRQPFGISLQKAYDFERDARNALSDPVSALRFIEPLHASRRRRLAAASVSSTMRRIENLETVVERTMRMRLAELVYVLRGADRHLPELSAVLRMRLSRVDVLERFIDANLRASPPSDFAALLTALRRADPQIHASAVDLLATPERASVIASHVLTAEPGCWIGLLRTPGVAHSVLSAVYDEDWVNFWATLPPKFPHWSRAIQQLLRTCGSPSLQRAPAEYVLLGAGPENWPTNSLSLKDLSNVLYGAGPLGSRMALRYLDRIGHVSLIDANYRQARIWAVASFLDAIHREQAPPVFRAMITSALFERLEKESRLGWVSLGPTEQAGFVALVGAMALAGVRVPLPFRRLKPAASDELRLASRHHPDGRRLLEAGLRSLALP
jgi:hypothetical protein